MRKIILLAIIGLFAQLIDGSLGMAYGVTSTTMLLFIGVGPAAASATVHLAEIGTTLVSGLAHWRFGNVDWRVVVRVGIPGALGAFVGATVLSSLSAEASAPIVSLLLLLLGAYVLLRSSVTRFDERSLHRPLRRRFLTPLGLIAGFVDATGGGGWGPVGTPALLASGRLEPRKVIGSIDASEFLVSLAASAGFLLGLGTHAINWRWIVGLLVGGVVAAPIAAWLVRWAPPHILGTAVGLLIVFTNSRTLMRSDIVGAPDALRWIVYGLILLVGVVVLTRVVHLHRRDSMMTELDPMSGENRDTESIVGP